MKKGDKTIMYFHAFGEISEEIKTVVESTDDVITLDDYKDVYDAVRDENTTVGRMFNRKTGECLNDTTFLGAKRTIKPQ